MKEYPLVSVVITCYNVAPYVEHTLKTWTEQDYQNLEIVVVEDVSSDNTLAVVEAAASRDSRIRVVPHEMNRGGHLARMTGLREASGDFFIFCDGDDWVHPELVSRCLKTIGSADCVMFQHDEIDDGSGIAMPAQSRRQFFAGAHNAVSPSPLQLGLLSHIAPVCFYRRCFRGSLERVFEKFAAPQYFDDVPSYLASISDCKLIFLADILYYYRVNRPGQSIEAWWGGERALKYQGLFAAFDQARRTGFLGTPRMRSVAFYKLLNIVYCEAAGLAKSNPGELTRLKRVASGEFKKLGVPPKFYADAPFLATFYTLFNLVPGGLLPIGLGVASKLQKFLKKA